MIGYLDPLQTFGAFFVLFVSLFTGDASGRRANFTSLHYANLWARALR
jgi:hypothetical protein